MTWRAAGIIAACMVSSVWAEETYVPATPVATEQVARWRLTRIVLDHGDQEMTPPMVQVQLVGLTSGGSCAHERGQCVTRSFNWQGAAATTLMTQLNTANLSTTSLTKRIWDKLTADGLLDGAVEGAP